MRQMHTHNHMRAHMHTHTYARDWKKVCHSCFAIQKMPIVMCPLCLVFSMCILLPTLVHLSSTTWCLASHPLTFCFTSVQKRWHCEYRGSADTVTKLPCFQTICVNLFHYFFTTRWQPSQTATISTARAAVWKWRHLADFYQILCTGCLAMLIVMHRMSKAFTNQIILFPGAWWKTVSKEFLLRYNRYVLWLWSEFDHFVFASLFSFFLFPFFSCLPFFPHFMSSLGEIWFILPWKWKTAVDVRTFLPSLTSVTVCPCTAVGNTW